MTQADPHDALLSIGAISRATGIPSETLRTWERRYGFPKPLRTAGGHRKYKHSLIAHLQLLQQAIEQGSRPSKVVGKSIQQLKTLLGISPQALLDGPHARDPQADPTLAAEPQRAPPGLLEPPQIIEGLMSATLMADAPGMRALLERCWYECTTMDFVSLVVAPFLERVGQEWYEGKLAVFHEQFASNLLRDFLRAQWVPLSERSAKASGQALLCTILPGEYHALGLHMTALISAARGCRVISLEQSSSLDVIVQTATSHKVSHVLLSISSAALSTRTTRQLAQLRQELPAHIGLLTGGCGAPKTPHSLRIQSLPGLESWLSSLEGIAYDQSS